MAKVRRNLVVEPRSGPWSFPQGFAGACYHQLSQPMDVSDDRYPPTSPVPARRIARPGHDQNPGVAHFIGHTWLCSLLVCWWPIPIENLWPSRSCTKNCVYARRYSAIQLPAIHGWKWPSHRSACGQIPSLRWSFQAHLYLQNMFVDSVSPTIDYNPAGLLLPMLVANRKKTCDAIDIFLLQESHLQKMLVTRAAMHRMSIHMCA